MIRVEPNRSGKKRAIGTICSYNGKVDGYLIPEFGDTPVRQIDKEHIRMMTDRLDVIPSPLNPKSKFNGIARPVLIVRMMILRQAARDGIIPAAPDVSVPKQENLCGATLAELMRRGGHADIRFVLRYQHAIENSPTGCAIASKRGCVQAILKQPGQRQTSMHTSEVGPQRNGRHRLGSSLCSGNARNEIRLAGHRGGRVRNLRQDAPTPDRRRHRAWISCRSAHSRISRWAASADGRRDSRGEPTEQMLLAQRISLRRA
ncbi:MULTISPECIES: hypothetical protein [Arthrobacter]|uniref:Uncharacterized protein n=2 Tax=Arthrobacter TaxID=1663 RepID=A0ABU9KHA6_9MICC|nr:hypothetical protein [Arthrobacter sp. YJM1]MDP5226151.1 hypothetical protein [Arthrobacter sp. YJM1]